MSNLTTVERIAAVLGVVFAVSGLAVWISPLSFYVRTPDQSWSWHRTPLPTPGINDYKLTDAVDKWNLASRIMGAFLVVGGAGITTMALHSSKKHAALRAMREKRQNNSEPATRTANAGPRRKHKSRKKKR